MAITQSKKQLLVYADWRGLANAPSLLGYLHCTQARGKENYSFEYSEKWLKSDFSQVLDPDLQLYPGAFYPRDDKPNFGIFLDSSPDRWGRVLMQRREGARAKLESRPQHTLLESDFLLGVFDQYRMGALRFKWEEEGEFMNDNKEMAAPPWTSLRQLQQASLKFEEDNPDDPEYLTWINLLLAPGGSLGGARPKASIVDPEGDLWIAKFPSRNDQRDIASWEIVANTLAVNAGINIAEARVQKFNNEFHTYLTKRFDRTNTGERIHFASAMTLLGYTDGERSAGASYLELAAFIMRQGANVAKDLEELWRRIVFNICIKNTDDHLRNHGFLLTAKGWILSPAYDLNPNEYGTGLELNISKDDNALDVALALNVSHYFRLPIEKAEKIIAEVKSSVASWKEVATRYSLTRAEQARMERAFVI